MGSIGSETSPAGAVLAILEGGPVTLPQASRTQTVSSIVEKIKVAHYGGYEHFERSENLEDDQHQEIVFRWTMRTEIAE